MNKKIWFLIILGIIIVILAVIVFWPMPKPATPVESGKITESTPPKVEGIQVTSPTQGQEVSSPLKITGVVNNGGWSGFEGQVGTVQLLDYKGNKVATGILKATTEWTTSPVSFETTLTFDAKTKGPMTLLFKNENASGDPSRDKSFGLPVVVK
jgi:hypothetical protein